MVDILIGTKNDYKATEMAYFLGRFPQLKVHYWNELSINIKVEEDQSTLKKNAEKKAKAISNLTAWYVLASDGGIDIPGLGQKWDILRNQRIVGENKTDLEKANNLLRLMEGLKGETRKVSYHLALALALKGKIIWSTEQISDRGYIIEKLPDQKIPPYRWVGHIWYHPQYGKVFNQLTEKQKEGVRKYGAGIKKSLRGKIQEILNSS